MVVMRRYIWCLISRTFLNFFEKEIQQINYIPRFTDILLPQLEKDDWLLFPGMGCLNNLDFINHSNVSGTRNYIYNKQEEEECFAPAKPCSWEFNSCHSIEINLDTFEILNFVSVQCWRGALVPYIFTKHTFFIYIYIHYSEDPVD